MGKLNCGMRACGVLLLWGAAAVALPAQTFTTIYNFCAQTGCTDGAGPTAALVQGADGNFYGTTGSGGAKNDGTVFSITSAGTLTTLYPFCSQANCTDGFQPSNGLVQAINGAFYGTTSLGGANDCDYQTGCGTIFSLINGVLTTLHSFDGADGSSPTALVQGTNGKFYGTTYNGGSACNNGCGTVFSITPGGALKTLHSFDNTDGATPNAGLVQGTNGDFYGTTSGGGANLDGTVFSITPSGTLMTLYSFCSQTGCADGDDPQAGLVQGADGDYYGTTLSGGANHPCSAGTGCGTVFNITPSGALTTLYSFCETGCRGDEGNQPVAALIRGTDGNFYGTTVGGGYYFECFFGCGTIFSITPGGALTTLYGFCGEYNCTDGNFPQAALVQGTDGNFYGTTRTGGAYGGGTVFRLSVGLGPFVKTLPTAGDVGTVVYIFGTSLTGSTKVAFRGTAATFTVVSASEIATTVPTGATTGSVQVVTPGGMLSSNLPFRVK